MGLTERARGAGHFEMDQLSGWFGVHVYALRRVELGLGRGDKDLLKLLELKGGDYSVRSKIGLSPVHTAVENQAILVLAYLYYEKKCDFEMRCNQGRTPFLYSIRLK